MSAPVAWRVVDQMGETYFFDKEPDPAKWTESTITPLVELVTEVDPAIFVSAFDFCSGGHPGGTYQEWGKTICRRCGRVLDMSECPHGLATDFCQECRA